MKSKPTKEEDILKEFWDKFGNVYDYTQEYEDFWLSKIKQTRKELMKSIVPEEKDIFIEYPYTPERAEAEGYNKCLADLLQRIKSNKEEI